MNSKKLLVFSDTHGNVSALKTVLYWAKDRLPPNDTIISAAFLGDGISDLHRAANETDFYCNWNLVSGNNDHGYSMPGTSGARFQEAGFQEAGFQEAGFQEAGVFSFCDYRFFMCHGHRHNVYAGYHTLISAARSNQADVVLFGHTHIPFAKKIDSLLLVNPGSVSRPRSQLGASFAVIMYAETQPLKIEFWSVGERGKISLLKL